MSSLCQPGQGGQSELSPWAHPLLPQLHQYSANSQPPPWGTNRPSHHLQTENSRGIYWKANSALGSVNTVSCTEKMRKTKKGNEDALVPSGFVAPLGAWAERALAEPAKGTGNRKTQGTEEEEKKLQHLLKTAASPRNSGYRGWEERGGGRFLASLLLQAPSAPQ